MKHACNVACFDGTVYIFLQYFGLVSCHRKLRCPWLYGAVHWLHSEERHPVGELEAVTVDVTELLCNFLTDWSITPWPKQLICGALVQEFQPHDCCSDIGRSVASRELEASFPPSCTGSPQQSSRLSHDADAASESEDERQLEDLFGCNQDDVATSFALQV